MTAAAEERQAASPLGVFREPEKKRHQGKDDPGNSCNDHNGVAHTALVCNVRRREVPEQVKLPEVRCDCQTQHQHKPCRAGRQRVGNARKEGKPTEAALRHTTPGCPVRHERGGQGSHDDGSLDRTPTENHRCPCCSELGGYEDRQERRRKLDLERVHAGERMLQLDRRVGHSAAPPLSTHRECAVAGCLGFRHLAAARHRPAPRLAIGNIAALRASGWPRSVGGAPFAALPGRSLLVDAVCGCPGTVAVTVPVAFAAGAAIARATFWLGSNCRRPSRSLARTLAESSSASKRSQLWRELRSNGFRGGSVEDRAPLRAVDRLGEL
mmetsp:Transcript_15442/g.58452  ORF Transcript_15442/g.58452 Transcript_15442/m.58452 type:complete len:325 (+) Transcript_15442:1922-2896(+)